MIKHKRVSNTKNGFYVFFPFGKYLSKGFVTKDKNEIEKAISRENRLSIVGFSIILGVYAKFHTNKELWVGLFYTAIAAAIRNYSALISKVGRIEYVVSLKLRMKSGTFLMICRACHA